MAAFQLPVQQEAQGRLELVRKLERPTPEELHLEQLIVLVLQAQLAGQAVKAATAPAV